MPTFIWVNISQYRIVILTQPSRYKIAENNLLEDERCPLDRRNVVVLSYTSILITFIRKTNAIMIITEI